MMELPHVTHRTPSSSVAELPHAAHISPEKAVGQEREENEPPTMRKKGPSAICSAKAFTHSCSVHLRAGLHCWLPLRLAVRASALTSHVRAATAGYCFAQLPGLGGVMREGARRILEGQWGRLLIGLGGALGKKKLTVE
jgi:hypothetical protein